MLPAIDFRLRRIRRQIVDGVSWLRGSPQSSYGDEDKKERRHARISDRYRYGWRRWTDPALLRLVIACVGFFLLIDYLTFTLNSLRWRPSTDAHTFTTTRSAAKTGESVPALVPGIKTVYISATHWNSAPILQSHWSAAVLDLIRHLGPENVYLSIYESGSWDDTKAQLRLLEGQLEEIGVGKTIVLDETTHLDIINQPEPPADAKAEGWVQTPRGKREVRRIPYLAQVRNKSLDPLARMTAEGRKFDRIIFLNDVIFSTADVINLLNTRNGSYASACALDFSHERTFYDSFALRDMTGRAPYSGKYPYLTSRMGRNAIARGEPVPVQSCWNGIAIFDAAPFQGRLHAVATSTSSSKDVKKVTTGDAIAPLRFRAIPDSLAAYHVEGSECCLIHYDNPLTQSKGVWVNPAVRVGYEPIAYDSVRSYPSTSESLFGWVRSMLAAAMKLPWRNPKINRRVAQWEAEKEGNYEPGVPCLTYEMQVLVYNGWAHV
ncbi:hypothetical protein KEM55_008890 [Ascosphaera atra]|nr:hypothetical protein KEM55_008890 [Ascosphaera atra]